MSEKFILPSHGKINWFLKIGETRSDGYHEIESLMQKIAFGDEIEVSLEERERDYITCNFSHSHRGRWCFE